MAFKSPGIYYNEVDKTDFTNPAAEVNTTVAIIGFAQKGPIGIPTEITTYNNYKAKFGNPISGQYSGLAIKSVLSAGGTVLFTRIADESIASKSSVVLKVGSEASDGKLVVNNKSDIVVGTPGYKNKAVYKGEITDGTSSEKTTLIVRTPASGKLSVSNLLKQITTSLGENPAFVESDFGAGMTREGLRNFSFSYTNESGENSTGYYFVPLYNNESHEAVVNGINSTIKNGTNAYQELFIDTSLDNVNIQENTVSINIGAAEKKKFMTLSINEVSNTVSVTITATTGTEITLEDLASQITTQLKEQGFNITVQCSYSFSSSDGSISNCDLLFISTDGKDFKVLPYVIEKGKPAKDSLFYFNTDIATSDDAYTTGVANDEENYINISTITTKVTNTADVIGITANYDSDIDSIVFKAIDTSITKFEIKTSTEFGYALFDNGISANEADAKSVKLSSINFGNIGKIVRSEEYKKASTFKATRNSDGQIEITKDGIKAAPDYKDLGGNNYESLSNLIGTVKKPAGVIEGETTALVKVSGQAANDVINNDMIGFVAKEYGSGTTDIGIEIYTSKSPIDETETHYINLYQGGTLKESWDDVSYDPEDKNYFVDLINDEPDNGGSAYVTAYVTKKNFGSTVNVLDTDKYSTDGVVMLGRSYRNGAVEKANNKNYEDLTSYDFSIGTNGIPENSEDLFLNAMNTENSGLSNKDLYSWHILITPDNISEAVQDQAISLCEYMEDAIYIADPPQGLTRKQVINWHNGSFGRSSALQSNYACTYWPWVKLYDSSESRYVWGMPSIVMAAQFCKVDNNYAPWYAPAGETNGLLSTAIDIEEYPNKIDRDALYLDQNRVNPLLMLRNGNILAYGEKTCQRKNSTLTKIHTRRMLIALKKELNAAIKGFIFLPTMTENITTIRSRVVAIMEEYKQGGGVDSYNVICDGTNNTTETLQQDILNIDIACVPNGCIEQVNISLTLNKSAEA